MQTSELNQTSTSTWKKADKALLMAVNNFVLDMDSSTILVGRGCQPRYLISDIMELYD